MHNRSIAPAGRHHVPRWLAALLAFGLVLTVSCLPQEPQDGGAFTDLKVDTPAVHTLKGANIWVLRQADDSVTVFWGISPIAGGENGRVRCLIYQRRDRTFAGEELPFVDPCNGAWWSRDGRFLGYLKDGVETAGEGPPLVQIGAEVRDGRVTIDEERLRCYQVREPGCR